MFTAAFNVAMLDTYWFLMVKAKLISPVGVSCKCPLELACSKSSARDPCRSM